MLKRASAENDPPDGVADFDDDLQSDIRAVSTHALLALCLRWSSLTWTKGGMVNDDDRRRAACFAHAMVGTAVSGGLAEITFVLDEDSEWRPRACPIGARSVCIQVVAGCLRLAPLAQNRARGAQRLVATLRAAGVCGTGAVSFVNCLSFLSLKASTHGDLAGCHVHRLLGRRVVQ